MKKNSKILTKDILAGNRRAIAKAITLIESTVKSHKQDAQILLTELLPFAGKSRRIGLTGTPGVGKSTFIEIFGRFLTAKGHKVAVLAVDPSSTINGGSILGDKTRMEELSTDPNAFIRPSPTSGTLGGVARNTREAVLILEAAGYDIILIETVGVGQSEVAVADLVDIFLLLLSPAGGDDLQGIKRGIMELADLVIVNKADGDLLNAAMHAKSNYQNALHLMRPKTPNWTVDVLLTSALEKKGIEEVWQKIDQFFKVLGEADEINAFRKLQNKAWMWSEIKEGLLDAFQSKVKGELSEIEQKLMDGKITATQAASTLINKVIKEE